MRKVLTLAISLASIGAFANVQPALAIDSRPPSYCSIFPTSPSCQRSAAEAQQKAVRASATAAARNAVQPHSGTSSYRTK